MDTNKLTLAVISIFVSVYAYAEDKPKIIELSQTPCVIVESEESPKEYVAKKYDDCVQINKQTKGKRKLKTIRLKPGKTISPALGRSQGRFKRAELTHISNTASRSGLTINPDQHPWLIRR